MSTFNRTAKTLFATTSMTKLAAPSAALVVSGLLVLAASPAFAQAVPPANAVPTGGNVSSGQATIVTDAPNSTVNVNQSTDRVVIDWNSFDIGSGAATHFNQPGANSIAVNRVGTGTNPTQIMGTLTGNGQVVILNKNGVVFGSGSQVDVNGLVASTGSLVDEQGFSNGQVGLKLTNINAVPTAKVENNGTIKTVGLAALVAPNVINNGVIEANVGKIALAAGGNAATVDLYGDGMVNMTVNSAAKNGLIDNKGNLTAQKIAITAAAADALVGSTINMSGSVAADTVSMNGSTINLGASAPLSMNADATATASKSVNVQNTVNMNGKKLNVASSTLNLNGKVNNRSGASTSTASTVNVQSNAASVQQAVDMANTGATVNVAAGTYNENVYVNKSLVFKGANAGVAGSATRGAETIIDGGTGTNTFWVEASNVTVDGFTFQNGSNTLLAVKQDPNAPNLTNVTFQNNIVKNAAGTGLWFSGISNSSIKNNWIDNTTGSDNIRIINTAGVTIDGNLSTNGNRTGILVSNSTGAVVTNNIVDKTNVNGGIWLQLSNGVTVANNSVKNTAGAGIQFMYMDGNNVADNNTINDSRGGGIYAIQSGNLTLSNNKIGQNSTAMYGDGINVNGNVYTTAYGYGSVVGSTNIVNNTIGGNFLSNGVYMYGGNNNTISGNTVQSAVNGNGIYAANMLGTSTISNNSVSNAGFYGIGLNENQLVNLTGNVVNNSGVSGLYVQNGVATNRVNLAGNVVNSAAGKTGATFMGGLIDMTGAANTFNGGNRGLFFDGAYYGPNGISLVGNTLGATAINGVSGYYIELANGALFGAGTDTTVIDSRNVSFDGFAAKNYTLANQAAYDAMMNRFVDYIDTASLGWLYYTYPGQGVTSANVLDVLPSQPIGQIVSNSRGSVTILGMPFASGSLPAGGAGAANFGGASIADLANISTAAGGNKKGPTTYNGEAQNTELSAADLNEITTAAGGGQSAGCWGQVYNTMSASSAPVTYNLDSSPNGLMNDQVRCTQTTGEAGI